jgi:hypothetical protein
MPMRLLLSCLTLFALLLGPVLFAQGGKLSDLQLGGGLLVHPC